MSSERSQSLFGLYFNIILFIDFLAVLGLHCFAWAFLSSGASGSYFLAVRAFYGGGFWLQRTDSRACGLQ